MSPTLSFCFLYCHKLYRNNKNAFRKFFLLRFQLAQSIWKSAERPKTVKKSSSEYGHVGTLSRRAEKPNSMQKELVNFDALELRKRPKNCIKLVNIENCLFLLCASWNRNKKFFLKAFLLFLYNLWQYKKQKLRVGDKKL